MLRTIAKSFRNVLAVNQLQKNVAKNVAKSITPYTVPLVRNMSSKVIETDEEFDARFEAYFSRPDIDSWELRKGIDEMHSMDLIPEPKIIIAVFHACRRLNDFALATRYLECVKDKCGTRVKEVFPYIIQEIKPTMDELGISTLEDLGYDKPEMYLPQAHDIH